MSLPTYNHESKLEAFLDRLSVYLVGKVGKPHIARLFWIDKLKVEHYNM